MSPSFTARCSSFPPTFEAILTSVASTWPETLSSEGGPPDAQAESRGTHRNRKRKDRRFTASPPFADSLEGLIRLQRTAHQVLEVSHVRRGGGEPHRKPSLARKPLPQRLGGEKEDQPADEADVGEDGIYPTERSFANSTFHNLLHGRKDSEEIGDSPLVQMMTPGEDLSQDHGRKAGSVIDHLGEQRDEGLQALGGRPGIRLEALDPF